MIRAAVALAVLAAAPLLLIAPADAVRAPVAATTTPNGFLSPSAFLEYVAAAIAKRRPNAKILRIDVKTLKITEAGREEFQAFLDNIWAQYQSEPDRLESIVDRYVLVLASASDGRTLDRVEQLVVIVRPTDYITRQLASDASLKNFLSSKPLAGDLSLFLAVDSDVSIRNASPQDLERWGLTESAAWSRAIANIRLRLGPVVISRLDGKPDNVLVLGTESGLAPSMLALPEACDAQHPNGVEGRVVLLVTKEFLYFGRRADLLSMQQFWQSAAAEIRAGATASATPITCHDGQWQAVPLP